MKTEVKDRMCRVPALPGAALQVGFVPDSDCAPVVVAQESGLFEKYELQVELHRETRWATLRDKIIYGELDAAQAPATLPFITNLGLESDQCACIAGLVLSLQGNAITLARPLWDSEVRDAAALRDRVYRNWGRRTFTFAVEFAHAPPYFLLRQWLKAGGVAPHREVRIVALPPAQMYPALKLGYIDGFCAGEPWTTLAVEAGAAVCVATSAQLAPLHPEKVFTVRQDFAQHRADEHERLLAALLEACAFCDRPENHATLAEILSRPQYVNAPADCLRQSLRAATESSGGSSDAGDAGLNIFYRHNANDPTDDRAAWLMNRLHDLVEQSVLKVPLQVRTPVVKNIFRRDLFQRAKALVNRQAAVLNAEAESWQADRRIA